MTHSDLRTILLFWILNKASSEEKETFQDWIGTSFYFPCSNSWSLLLLNTWSHFWGDNRKYLFIIYWHARWFMKILRKTEVFRVTLGHSTTMPNALLPENKCSHWPEFHKSFNIYRNSSQFKYLIIKSRKVFLALTRSPRSHKVYLSVPSCKKVLTVKKSLRTIPFDLPAKTKLTRWTVRSRTWRGSSTCSRRKLLITHNFQEWD